MGLKLTSFRGHKLFPCNGWCLFKKQSFVL